MIVYKNGQQQLIITVLGTPKREYRTPREDEKERGKVRKAIEDMKIERELVTKEVWE